VDCRSAAPGTANPSKAVLHISAIIAADIVDFSFVDMTGLVSVTSAQRGWRVFCADGEIKIRNEQQILRVGFSIACLSGEV
jgi:hypothetical protein